MERYDEQINGGLDVEKDGDWIKWEDAESLQSELTASKEDNTKLREEIKEIVETCKSQISERKGMITPKDAKISSYKAMVKRLDKLLADTSQKGK